MSASFRQQVEELVNQRDQLSDDAVRRILSLLGELHERVLAQLATRPDLTARDAGALRVEIERLMRAFESRLATEVSGYQQQAWDLSDDAIDAQLARAGIRTGIVAVSTETLRLVQGMAFTQVTKLTREQMDAITRELQVASLGGRSFTELTTNIGRNLDSPSVFGTIATRAEVIARTSVGQAYEYGNTVRGNEAAEVLPGLQKTWLHSTGAMPRGKQPAGMYRPRATHVALHRVTIPWGDKFNVGGFEADGPMDASLPAKEVVNCLCTRVLNFDALSDSTLRQEAA